MKNIGKIIVFSLSVKNDISTMNRFCRQFYGYLDRSNNYKYRYKRKGLLDDFQYIKPHKGVLVVRKVDSDEIIQFLESYNATIYARDLILEPVDIEKLMNKGDKNSDSVKQ